MTSQALREYIQMAKDKGFTNKEIEVELLNNGWSEDDIKEELSSRKEKLPAPPLPYPHVELWITFEYALLFISLYVTAISIAGVLHYIVDKYLNTNTLNPYSYSLLGFWRSDSLLRTALAGLIIGFPLFGILFLDIQKRLIKVPALKHLRARKQIIYITLVITFVIMLIHLFQVLVEVLNGEVKMTSLAHMGVTMVVAGSIFGYFLHDVREDRHV